jgi:hypothetical protein
MKDERQWKPPTLELIDSQHNLHAVTGGSFTDCCAKLLDMLDRQCGPELDIADVLEHLAEIAFKLRDKECGEAFKAESKHESVEDITDEFTLIYEEPA